MKVLEQLRLEHQQILNMFATRADILEIIRFVEEIHHPLEEKELFPLIASSPQLNQQSGPKCMFFWGMELDFSPQKRPREYLEKLYTQGLPRPTPYTKFSWLSESSFLNIPMSEHDLGHNLAEAIKFLSIPENQKKYDEAFEMLCYFYEDLLRQHIAKEDECLFMLCEVILKS